MTWLDWLGAGFCFLAAVAFLTWVAVNLADAWPRMPEPELTPVRDGRPLSPSEPRSPMELYLEGGGDLSNLRVAALLAEAERGWNRRNQPDDHEEHLAATPPKQVAIREHTEPATINQYTTWLHGYFASGGRPTHFYDYPFATAQFVIAHSDIVIDSDAEFGSSGRHIIVPAGRRVLRTNPHAAFNGYAHTSLYFMPDRDRPFRNNNDFVPVYNDPEFEVLLTEEHRQLRDEAARKSAEFYPAARRAHGRSSRPRVLHAHEVTPDDAAMIRTMAKAHFGPNATVTLPSGRTITGDEMQRWIEANDEPAE